MNTAATATTIRRPRRNSGALPVAKCATTPSIASPITGSICGDHAAPARPDLRAVARQRRPVTHQQCGRRGADEQGLHAGVGAEVDAVQRGRRVQTPSGMTRPPTPPHPRRRRRRRPCGPCAASAWCRGAPQQCQRDGDGQQHQRPQHVVLLLDRERPGVLQRRRRVALREVVGVADDEDPVGNPEEGADGVVAHGGDGVGREQFAQPPRRQAP